ncbi:coiled-coil domain-containing protein 91 isoform X1 [Cygnus atratus]|uniref:coiled-coil domain-containing protein 91 isoform X1 n=1 Tax=Cygnus atratus TaxID=8868 RepID=UPI0015D5C438|nr:coiled-coil domain-containing protein 91 isoform X1 [Cygnus atratus]XP_035406804.1 coiled-coil domain-containing protein 91 isoform X1 [Cygnus atratus]XP_035406805.1 coiled-coil domain-containing protein 91 isoform X1 [Cygnus atratus]XP_035406806.1 coiled-coil domain-containing protein 91 isoform X1 [Cygnus atratus]XP_035406807.1 coiled-coil domain-containing protein 91 isoform X1 [Cygnus atratus]XP_035406809.1 coiled-coil domain-containing protein 91 isoform X1 [Cygnus atratus]XP_03540681
MDDDDFGGFEAAESYEYGNGEKQTTSPAISWAAFPTVSEVHISQNVSPDVLLEHSVPSSCLVPPDSFTLSNDNVATAIQTANVINPAVLKEQNQVDIQVASLNLNEDISLVTSAVGTDDNETKRKNELKSCLQQTVANLETKLCTAEEEKIKTKKELEYLLEKNSILEMNFLKEKKEKLLKYQDRYKMIQEKHKQELEDMRQAGHEALSIIVEEFKALLQSTVQQQEAAIEKQYILAIEKQSHKCEELLNAQHQRLLDILEAEKEVLSEKIEEALMQQSEKHKEVLDKCLDEERERSKEAVAAAMKAEKKIVQEAVLKAVEEERRNMEKIHEEERKMWETERDRHKEKIAQAVREAMQEQRKHNQEIVKEALMEEQKRSEKAIEEAVKRTREELVEYIKEQKRCEFYKEFQGTFTFVCSCVQCNYVTDFMELDQVVRQRNLSSLELFLSCAQKQLGILLNEDPTATEEKRD